MNIITIHLYNFLIAAGFTDISFGDEGNNFSGMDENASTPLVEYCFEKDQWIPLCSPCKQAIPQYPTTELKTWAQKRLDLVDVDRTLDKNNMMLGLPCMPASKAACPKCSASTRDAVKLEKRPFTLRTYRGAVLRRVFDVQCTRCQDIRSWDPYSECILTINDGREGGEKHDVVSLV
jgi:hypothetical protein